MKKQYCIITLVAAVMALVASGCQKEKLTDTVTLGAVLHESVTSDSKLYIDGYTPCWHNEDMVFINDDVYPVAAAYGSSARIEDVTSSASGYHAIFPASIVVLDPSGSYTNLIQSTGPSVFLPSHQPYRKAGGYQRVQVPMGANLTSSEGTLEFHNLCSVVRVTVSNSTSNDITLKSITLQARRCCLSGRGVATIYGDDYFIEIEDDPERGDDNVPNHSVTLDCPGEVIPYGQSGDFDIVVPRFLFGEDDITITVNMTVNGSDCSHKTTKRGVALPNNTITTTTVTVRDNEILGIEAGAYLVDGDAFRTAIRNATQAGDAISVKFEYNSTRNASNIANCVVLSLLSSNTPIYGYLDETVDEVKVWRVFTEASKIIAHADCSQMFRVSDYDGNTSTTTGRIAHIDFGDGFITSSVTDMSSMFCECTRLTVLDVTSFNTENVIEMSQMFSYCRNLRNLDLSNFNTGAVIRMSHMFSYDKDLRYIELPYFNTENVLDMGYMFYGCESLTKLDLSSFNTSSLAMNQSGIGMGYMFSGCLNMTELNIHDFEIAREGVTIDRIFSGLSQNSYRCKITCKSAMKTAIENSSDFPSNVSFTWNCWDE